MTITLKLLHERKNGPYRKVDGYSGRNYKFTWSKQHDAYIGELTKQDQVEDLCKMPNRMFAPVMIVETETAAKPAKVDPEELAKRDILAQLLSGVGVSATKDDPLDVLERLLRAYDKGKADGVPAAVAQPLPQQSPTKPTRRPKKAAAT